MRRTSIVLTLAGLAAVSTGSAFAQAAAEAAMSTAHSAATTVKAGSALGQSLNRAMGGIGQRISSSTSSAVPRRQLARTSSTKVVASPIVSSRQPAISLITSIQGNSRSCPATVGHSKSGENDSGSRANQTVPPPDQGTNCAKHASAAEESQQKYKRIITLPAASAKK
jgi:hypothetical protein